MENTKVNFKDVPLNIYLVMKGWMAKDAVMSDRICSKCGRYLCSHLHKACPYCGSIEIRPLTLPDGTRCCLVEGAFYPLLTKGTEDRWKADLKKYTKYLVPTYGFRIRSVEQDGVLQAPLDYPNIKKDALIEIKVRNHLWLSEPFLYGNDPEKTKWPGRKGVHYVFGLRPNYGDTFKILQKAAVNKSMCSKSGNANVSAPLPEGADKMAVMQMFVECGKRLGLNMDDLLPKPATAEIKTEVPSEPDMSGEEATFGAGGQQVFFNPDDAW